MKHKESIKMWKRALEVFPGGVNSPVRAFRSVGGDPVVIASAQGAYLTDTDENTYLDFVNSWGPLVLGHGNKKVLKALKEQSELGTSYGAVSIQEIKLGEFILKHVPHIERIRFVNSGTEAVMTALRLARGITGRDLIVKFDGCYHGHSDGMLVNAGSGLLTASGDISVASSPGIPAETAKTTLTVPLDDEPSFQKIFELYGDKIAAVIIEPLPANAGLLKQRDEFLKLVRDITIRHGALLILDEVISGFRLGISGFAGKYGVTPDIVTYGKIIGGGLPVGAVGGSREVMNHLAPAGPVYQAGTLSGNPLAMAAGLATLNTMLEKNGYDKLSDLAKYLGKEFNKLIPSALEGKDYDMTLVQEDSLFWFNFHVTGAYEPVRRVDRIWNKSALIYRHLFKALLNDGVYLAPSAYEVGFLSVAMETRDIDLFLQKLAAAIRKSPTLQEMETPEA